MCRLFIYQGPKTGMHDLLIRPGHSLLKQSYESQERTYSVNADGFGVAWYQKDISQEPAVFREITPAWSNRNLIEISRLIESSRIFAHVRAASHGIPVDETNCHPFKHENMLWMHNGKIASFKQIKRQISNLLCEEAYNTIQGSTDSEYAFALFLHELWKVKKDNYESGDYTDAFCRMLNIIFSLTQSFEDHNSLNFAFTDGKTTLVSRFSDSGKKNPPSLYYSAGKSMVYRKNKLQIEQEAEENFLLIASEPLNYQPDAWEEIPENTLMLINENLNYHFIKIDKNVRMDNL
jgi:predicted glutamine amidotransferase